MFGVQYWLKVSPDVRLAGRFGLGRHPGRPERPGLRARHHHPGAGGALVDTINRLPRAQRYDYVFDGDSESLSGLLVSPALNRPISYAAPVHINADFAGQTSDHDSLPAYFNPPR
jgi:hypothetical protein